MLKASSLPRSYWGQTMPTTEVLPLSAIYEQDETAWLEVMSTLAAEGRYAEMDHLHLSEYLADMAKRDRREVSSRLIVLLTHLLKWEHQPGKKSASWLATILEQRQELRNLLDSRTLYNHAAAVLPDAYVDACKRAAAETSLPRAAFPAKCSWDLARLLADEDEEDAAELVGT
jgi:hypothetical protein